MYVLTVLEVASSRRRCQLRWLLVGPLVWLWIAAALGFPVALVLCVSGDRELRCLVLLVRTPDLLDEVPTL